MRAPFYYYTAVIGYTIHPKKQLQGDPPSWVAGVVKAWTDCGYIRCIEKYSKYQHVANHAIARSPVALATMPVRRGRGIYTYILSGVI